MMPSQDLLMGKAAILTIDFQNDFCHPAGAAAKLGNNVDMAVAAAEQMSWFLQSVRAYGIPVLHARTHHGPWTDSPAWKRRQRGASLFCTESWGADFYGISPEPSDLTITKHRYSAALGTELDMVLRSLGVESLIVGGVATNVCVESTVRDAFMLGYWTVALSDCCGCYDQQDQVHSLNTMGRYFGLVSDARTMALALSNDR